MHTQKVPFYVVAIFKTFPRFDIFGKQNRPPSHPSGLARRSQAVWAKGRSSHNSPLGVTTACLQTFPNAKSSQAHVKFAQMFLVSLDDTDISFGPKWPNWLQVSLQSALRHWIRSTVEDADCGVSEDEQKQEGEKSPSPIAQMLCLTESCGPPNISRRGWQLFSHHRQIDISETGCLSEGHV